MFEYKVQPFNTGIFSGALDPQKFESKLNAFGREGWEFVRSVHETRKVFFLFSREAHFLVFKKEGRINLKTFAKNAHR